jgi:hypothetical protein
MWHHVSHLAPCPAVNRRQKTLDGGSIKPSVVATDLSGVSA